MGILAALSVEGTPRRARRRAVSSEKDPKDRLGDKLRDAEKAREEQYFAQREKELLERLKARLAKEKPPERPE